MRHIHSLADANLDGPSMVTIGVFDGVHRGHQYVVAQLVTAAKAANATSVVLTFHPHPALVIRGPQPRHYLTMPDEKAALLHDFGVGLVITHPFDDEVRHIRAAAFVDQLLNHLQMAEIWVGADFAMGYQREGDVKFLKAQAKEKRFALRVVDLMDAGGEKVSSSRVRSALAEGDVAEATYCLGRPFRLRGEVVLGDRRGHTIGFPTANLALVEEHAIPARGVYAAWARVGERQRVPSVVNVGIRPTFDTTERTVVEAHLLDFDADLYGQQLTLDFIARLRGEQRFDGVAELVAQVGRDIERARRIFAQ
ncbi:MAG: bifunctional riboflavin kinase/FAD synthetase, partial [Anaerolineae bacterium]